MSNSFNMLCKLNYTRTIAPADTSQLSRRCKPYLIIKNINLVNSLKNKLTITQSHT